MTLILKSHDFTHQGEIPKSFTCDGDDSSPTLSWTGLPQNTKSLVLIVDDPDAPDPAKPKMTWVHWLLYNTPPTVTELPKAIAASDLQSGTLQGNGRAMAALARRYFHKFYALDIELPDLHLPNKTQLEKAMAGHIIDQAELVGTYQHQ